MRNAFKILVENLKGRGHFRHLGIDGRIILIDFNELGCVDGIQLVQDRV